MEILGSVKSAVMSAVAGGVRVRPPLAATRAAGQSLAAVMFVVLALLALAPIGPARAHEMQALVADVELTGGRLVLRVRANAEAMLAGIGGSHDDTDEAPEAARYDALRALPAPELAERIAERTAMFAAAIGARTPTRSIDLALTDVEVVDELDPLLARTTKLVIVGELPSGAPSVRLRLEAPGDLIVRGTGTNEAYGEFLQGGAESQPIPVPPEPGMLGGLLRSLGLGD